MTTLTADLISLRSPAALCCAVPHLLGFHPHESAVVLWLHAGRLLLTQRIDLPRETEIAAWCDALWRHQAVSSVDEIVVVLVSDAAEEALLRAALQEISGEAEQRGIVLRDGLHLTGDRWRSLLCRDRSCCPESGLTIDQQVRTLVALEFAPEDAAPQQSREEVLAGLHPRCGDVESVRATGILSRPTRRQRRERWRDGAIGNMVHWWRSEGEPAPAGRIAHLLLGLRDIRVRDTILWELCRLSGPSLRCAQRQLTRLLHAAPDGDVAPIATCVGLATWLGGDGVRAAEAVALALNDEPNYSLAGMLQMAIEAGIPPGLWRETLLGMTREECRQAGTTDCG